MKEEEFRKFVESKIVKLYNRKGSLTKEEILDAVCQFDQSIPKFLDKKSANVSLQLKRIFNEKNKPIAVPLNTWFLFKFGYKKCGCCKSFIETDNFSRDKRSWDLLNYICKFCRSTEDKNYRKNNPEKAKLSRKNWAKNNPDKISLYQKNWRENNSEKVSLYQKNWRKNNPEKVKFLNKNYYKNNPEKAELSRKNWRKNNHDKVNAYNAKYRATKLKATPKWLTKQDYIEIEDIYYQATEYERILEEKFHVDHIIPLQGKNVCGLHVPWNLQILTAKENLIKGNKMYKKELRKELEIEIAYLQKGLAEASSPSEIARLLQEIGNLEEKRNEITI